MTERRSQEKKIFGQIIKGLIKKPMTQKKIAEKIGVTRTTITHWVKGDDYPGIDNLLSMLLILKVDFRDFANKLHDENWGRTEDSRDIPIKLNPTNQDEPPSKK